VRVPVSCTPFPPNPAAAAAAVDSTMHQPTRQIEVLVTKRQRQRRFARDASFGHRLVRLPLTRSSKRMTCVQAISSLPCPTATSCCGKRTRIPISRSPTTPASPRPRYKSAVISGPDPVNVAPAGHLRRSGTASPCVGRRADGVKRFRRTGGGAPNGTTELQHRITGDALAEAAPNGIYPQCPAVKPAAR
jgi:hypothetical protein